MANRNLILGIFAPFDLDVGFVCQSELYDQINHWDGGTNKNMYFYTISIWFSFSFLPQCFSNVVIIIVVGVGC